MLKLSFSADGVEYVVSSDNVQEMANLIRELTGNSETPARGSDIINVPVDNSRHFQAKEVNRTLKLGPSFSGGRH